MTTVITRLFEDEAGAKKAVEKLQFRRIPARAAKIITASGDADALKAAMTKAQVHGSAVDAYAEHVEAGKALLVVTVTHIPLTAATIARNVLAKRETIPVDGITDDYYMADGPQPASSILNGHPLILSLRLDESKHEGRPISEGLGLRLLKAHRTKRSAIHGGGFKSRMFWPMPLLSHKERKNRVYRGGRHMSKAFWPMRLITRSGRRNRTIEGLTISRVLCWPTVS